MIKQQCLLNNISKEDAGPVMQVLENKIIYFNAQNKSQSQV